MTKEKFENLRIIDGNIWKMDNIIKSGKINDICFNQLFTYDSEFRNDFFKLRDKYLAKYNKLFEEA